MRMLLIGLQNTKLEVSASCVVSNKWSEAKTSRVSPTAFVDNWGPTASLLKMIRLLLFLKLYAYETTRRTRTSHETAFDKKACKKIQWISNTLKTFEVWTLLNVNFITSLLTSVPQHSVGKSRRMSSVQLQRICGTLSATTASVCVYSFARCS